jgi:tetratricopeptide (TPR) repeat protein
MTLRNAMIAAVVLELAAAATMVGLRLNSTMPAAPLVAQYTDTLTGRELLAFPGKFLFDSAAKWRNLAETYATFGYFAKADGCYRRLVASDRTPETAFYHGYCLVRLGRLDEASSEFRRVTEARDLRFGPRAWYFLGTIHLRREQPEEAMQAFERAGDEHLLSVFQRAKYLVRSGDVAEAAPLIDRLAEALPQDVKVWQLRAHAAEAQGHSQDAIAARDALDRAKVILTGDDTEEFFANIRKRFGMAREIAAAVEERRAGDVAKSADRLARLVRPGTFWENQYLYMVQDAAAIHLQAGNLAEARGLAVRQIEIEEFPTPTAWQIRGEADYSKQNWSQALEAWSHAERLKPNAVDHVKLATAVEHVGDTAAARRHLALAGLFNGVDLFREGELDEARTMFRQSLSIADDIADLWFYLAECERQLGEPRPAEAAYRRCLELNPAHGRAAVRLGEVEQHR